VAELVVVDGAGGSAVVLAEASGTATIDAAAKVTPASASRVRLEVRVRMGSWGEVDIGASG
jgi:hypothetical protein